MVMDEEGRCSDRKEMIIPPNCHREGRIVAFRGDKNITEKNLKQA